MYTTAPIKTRYRITLMEALAAYAYFGYQPMKGGFCQATRKACCPLTVVTAYRLNVRDGANVWPRDVCTDEPGPEGELADIQREFGKDFFRSFYLAFDHLEKRNNTKANRNGRHISHHLTKMGFIL